MNQIRINLNAIPDHQRTARLTVVCTRCGKPVRRVHGGWDCGTPHKPGSAQMMYKKILE